MIVFNKTNKKHKLILSAEHVGFLLFLQPDKRSHSSMDRISDSGSDDLGSNPGGITFKKEGCSSA